MTLIFLYVWLAERAGAGCGITVKQAFIRMIY